MPVIIGIDFDGTLAEHRYPEIGAKVPGAVETCRDLITAGHKLILWTMRSGSTLTDAVAWCAAEGIDFYGVNKNPSQDWSDSPKAYCHIYVDDAALGCPLVLRGDDRPFVDWKQVRDFFRYRGLL